MSTLNSQPPEALQQPVYSDLGQLQKVTEELTRHGPLVDLSEIRQLKEHLAMIAAGQGFLIQAGPCAEEITKEPSDIFATLNALIESAALVREETGLSVLPVLRGAGEFFKPRSTATETRQETTLPSYRGDGVNGCAFDPSARQPDPERLLQGYHYAKELTSRLRQRGVHSSHEALHMPYEKALRGFSGHMLWVGDRTRQVEGAHIKFLAQTPNPVGVKCGPSLTPDELIQLMERLNPMNEGGRLTLIFRLGADKIAAKLPRLIKAAQQAAKSAVFCCDPMHANTEEVNGIKTRSFDNIASETRQFFNICRESGAHPGGVHLEMSGLNVSECYGGGAAKAELSRDYRTLCDPRLNRRQMAGLMRVVADEIKRSPACAFRSLPSATTVAAAAYGD
jgi:3-deoxy-7-phosphoheptulonate synthase